MVSDVAAARFSPIKQIVTKAVDDDDLHARLQRAGFMRMMLIAEPRLSEFVKAYRALGYEVEVVPYEPEATGTETGCGIDSDASATSQSGGTVYVRKLTLSTGDNEGR